MPRTIDLIRASKLPSNMMQFAAKGALQVPPDENIEILVHLARHNKVFGDLARMTLAGWDEKASLAAALNPKTTPEVLGYFISPENLRPKLLPALLENASVSESELVKFAVSAPRDSIGVMLESSRVRACAAVLKSLRSNPYLKPEDAAMVAKLLSGNEPQKPQAAPTAVATLAAAGAGEPVESARVETHAASSSAQTILSIEESEDVPDEAVAAYLAQNASEIVAEEKKPFQPIGGSVDLLRDDHSEAADEKESAPATGAPSASGASAAAGRQPAAATPAQPAHRENTLQKINGLDVKGRIQLALKGNKEERSILIRDGTKVVALAVLEAPKLSDGEVEKFALQKNVLEAVLRQIPLKRQFMKNYIVVRNLVANPRTPLDLGLGLMKHLLVQDLKNISANKEVSETVRKLALKMYKQKMDSANKK
jgi:hypothetical protein